MFGRPLAEFLRFQRPVLVLLALVGLSRLLLSLLGLPDTMVRWLSMNAVLWAGTLYYGVAVHTRRFGGYKQLLPLVAAQVVLFQAIAVLGIALAVAGLPNIYAAPEYSFQAQSQWVHLVAHLTVGIVAPVLLLWGVASLVLLITRRSAPRVAPA